VPDGFRTGVVGGQDELSDRVLVCCQALLWSVTFVGKPPRFLCLSHASSAGLLTCAAPSTFGERRFIPPVYPRTAAFHRAPARYVTLLLRGGSLLRQPQPVMLPRTRGCCCRCISAGGWTLYA